MELNQLMERPDTGSSLRNLVTLRGSMSIFPVFTVFLNLQLESEQLLSFHNGQKDNVFTYLKKS